MVGKYQCKRYWNALSDNGWICRIDRQCIINHLTIGIISTVKGSNDALMSAGNDRNKRNGNVILTMAIVLDQQQD